MKRLCSVTRCVIILGTGAALGQQGVQGQSALRPVGKQMLESHLNYRERGLGLGIRLEDKDKAIPAGRRESLPRAIRARCGGYFKFVTEKADFYQGEDWWALAGEEGRTKDERIGLVALVQLHKEPRREVKWCRITYFAPDFTFPPVEKRLGARVQLNTVADFFASTYPLVAKFSKGKWPDSQSTKEAGKHRGVALRDRFVPVKDTSMYLRFDLGAIEVYDVDSEIAIAKFVKPFSSSECGQFAYYIRQPSGLRDLAHEPLTLKCERERLTGSNEKDYEAVRFLSVKVYFGLHYETKEGEPLTTEDNILVGAIPSNASSEDMCQSVTDTEGLCVLSLPMHFPFVLDVAEFSPAAGRNEQGTYFLPWLSGGPRIYEFVGGATTLVRLRQGGEKVKCVFRVKSEEHMTWHLYVDNTFMGGQEGGRSRNIELAAGKHEYYITPNRKDLLRIPYYRAPRYEDLETRNPLPFFCGRRAKPLQVRPGPDGIFYEDARFWRDASKQLQESLKRGKPKPLDIETHDDGGVTIKITPAGGTEKNIRMENGHPQLLEVALLLTWDSYAMQDTDTAWRFRNLPLDRKIELLETVREVYADQIWDTALDVTLCGLMSEQACESIVGGRGSLSEEALRKAIERFEKADKRLKDYVDWPLPRKKTDEDWLALRYQTFRVFALHTFHYFESLLILAKDCIKPGAKYESNDPLAERLNALMVSQATRPSEPRAAGIVGRSGPLKWIKGFSRDRKNNFLRFVEDEYPKPKYDDSKTGKESTEHKVWAARRAWMKKEIDQINDAFSGLEGKEREWLKTYEDWRKTRMGAFSSTATGTGKPRQPVGTGMKRVHPNAVKDGSKKRPVREPVHPDAVKDGSKKRRPRRQPVTD